MRYRKVLFLESSSPDLDREECIVSGQSEFLERTCLQLDAVSHSLRRYLNKHLPNLVIDGIKWEKNIRVSKDTGELCVSGLALYAALSPQVPINESLEWADARFRIHVLFALFLTELEKLNTSVQRVLVAQEKTRRKKPVHILESGKSGQGLRKHRGKDSVVYTSNRELAKHLVGCINKSLGLDEWFLRLGEAKLRMGASSDTIRICSRGPVVSTQEFSLQDSIVRAVHEANGEIYAGVDGADVGMRKKIALLLVNPATVLTGSFRILAQNHGKFDKFKGVLGKVIGGRWSPTYSRVVHEESKPRSGVLMSIDRTLPVKQSPIPIQHELEIDRLLQYACSLQREVGFSNQIGVR